MLPILGMSAYLGGPVLQEVHKWLVIYIMELDGRKARREIPEPSGSNDVQPSVVVFQRSVESIRKRGRNIEKKGTMCQQ